MKNSSFFLSLGGFILMLTALSCVKDSEEDRQLVAAEIESVIEKLHKSFFEFEVLGGPESQIFQIENSGMNGIYGLTRDTDNLGDDDQNLFDCIQNTNPSVFQLLRLQTATNSFSDCRAAVTPVYIEEVAAAISIKEQLRVELFAQFYAGQISAEEVELQLATLKSEIKSEVLEIKNKYSAEFRNCLNIYIRDINSAINRDQWVIFKDCV